MRLSGQEIDAIKATAAEVFGTTARVYLFGSRVDYSLRGGDIDLMVEVPGDVYDALDFLSGEGRFLALLKGRFGDQRIDVVIRPAGREPTAIERTALETGVAL
jgi:predicted nucleotidyltransferase